MPGHPRSTGTGTGRPTIRGASYSELALSVHRGRIMKFRTKLAALTAAGVAALASSHANTSTAITGPELISGTVHGKAALANTSVIPLAWRGLVNTYSVLTLGGGGPHPGDMKTLGSPVGKLTVMVTTKPTQRQSFNAETCRLTFTQDIPLAVVGSKSTGVFAGASGPGAAEVYFAATAPRYKTGPKKGQCNSSGQPLVQGAVASFLASQRSKKRHDEKWQACYSRCMPRLWDKNIPN